MSQSEGCQKVEDPQRRTTATQALTHKSRKKQRHVFSWLTTSLPQKETHSNLKMSHPEYEAKIAKQRSAYSQARAPARPTIDGRAVPSHRAIRNSKYILANAKYEPKPCGMKEVGTRSTKSRGRVPILPPRKLSYGRTLTGVSDAPNGIPSDGVRRKVERHARKRG